MENVFELLDDRIKAEIQIDDKFDNTICFLIRKIIKQRYNLDMEQEDDVDEYMYQSGAYESLSKIIKACDKYGEEVNKS